MFHSVRLDRTSARRPSYVDEGRFAAPLRYIRPAPGRVSRAARAQSCRGRCAGHTPPPASDPRPLQRAHRRFAHKIGAQLHFARAGGLVGVKAGPRAPSAASAGRPCCPCRRPSASGRAGRERSCGRSAGWRWRRSSASCRGPGRPPSSSHATRLGGDARRRRRRALWCTPTTKLNDAQWRRRISH